MTGSWVSCILADAAAVATEDTMTRSPTPTAVRTCTGLDDGAYRP